MPKKKKSKPDKTPQQQGQALPPVKSVSMTSLGRAKVSYGPHPPKPPEEKKIHARRPLPQVREAPESRDADAETSGAQNQQPVAPKKDKPE